MIGSMEVLVFLIPIIFIASFVDSIAGGGGLISLPSYSLFGLPLHSAYGTNKFVNCSGTIIAALTFIKNKQVHFKTVCVGSVMAIIGAVVGAKMVLMLDEKYLMISLIIFIPIMCITLLRSREFGEVKKQLPSKSLYIRSGVFCFIVGIYDGFFGPGTGTLLTLGFIKVCHFDILTATGNAKVINMFSNISALGVYFFEGQILFRLAIPLTIFAMMGGFIGSKFVMKYKANISKPCMLLTLGLLFVNVIIRSNIF